VCVFWSLLGVQDCWVCEGCVGDKSPTQLPGGWRCRRVPDESWEHAVQQCIYVQCMYCSTWYISGQDMFCIAGAGCLWQ
jgi:hypothetical protein